jgi:hypothetical protein
MCYVNQAFLLNPLTVMYSLMDDGRLVYWSEEPLRNQRSQLQIPVVSRGFCDEQLHLLGSHGCLYNKIYYHRYNLYMYDLCMLSSLICYLVSVTQVLRYLIWAR